MSPTQAVAALSPTQGVAACPLHPGCGGLLRLREWDNRVRWSDHFVVSLIGWVDRCPAGWLLLFMLFLLCFMLSSLFLTYSESFPFTGYMPPLVPLFLELHALPAGRSEACIAPGLPQSPSQLPGVPRQHRRHGSRPDLGGGRPFAEVRRLLGSRGGCGGLSPTQGVAALSPTQGVAALSPTQGVAACLLLCTFARVG